MENQTDDAQASVTADYTGSKDRPQPDSRARGIPETLRKIPKWLLWGGEGNKRPRRLSGELASKTNPDHWIKFEDLSKATWKPEGAGIVVMREDNLIAVDLDNVVRPDGEVEEWVTPILDAFRGTYIEFSPSERGLHIFAKATDGFPSRRTRVEINKELGQRIEVYTNASFMTITGKGYAFDDQDVTDQQFAFDWLVHKYLLATPSPAKQQTEDVPDWCLKVDMDMRVRAGRQLIAKADRAIAGQGGHNQTFIVASQLVRGLCITDPGKAMLLLDEYNRTKCDPMWSEKELSHKFRQAMTNSREFAWGDKYFEYGLVEGFLVGGVIHPELPKAPPAPPAADVNELLEVGDCVLGDLIQYAKTNAGAFLPHFGLWGALGLLACAAGRKYTDPSQSTLNVYLCGLAPTGAGKSDTLKPFHAVADATGFGDVFRKQSIGSKQGLLRWLADQPSMTCVIDEIHAVIASLNDQKDTIQRGLMREFLDLFSSGNRQYHGELYATKEKNVSIDRPCFSIIGASTPDAFRYALDPANIESGLVGRMLVLQVDEKAPFVDKDFRETAAIPQRIKDCFDWLKEFKVAPGEPIKVAGVSMLPGPTVIDYSSEAKRLMKEFYDEANRKTLGKGDIVAGVWVRSVEKAKKLALLRAISRDWVDPREVRGEEFEWAMRVVRHCHEFLMERAHNLGPQSDRSKQVNRVRQLIRDRGPIKRWMLSKRLDYPSKTLDEILQQLSEQEEIGIEAQRTGGRSATVYYWIQGC